MTHRTNDESYAQKIENVRKIEYARKIAIDAAHYKCCCCNARVGLHRPGSVEQERARIDLRKAQDEFRAILKATGIPAYQD